MEITKFKDLRKNFVKKKRKLKDLQGNMVNNRDILECQRKQKGRRSWGYFGGKLRV